MPQLKSYALLDWSPSTSLEVGLSKMIKAYKPVSIGKVLILSYEMYFTFKVGVETL